MAEISSKILSKRVQILLCLFFLIDFVDGVAEQNLLYKRASKTVDGDGIFILFWLLT